MRRSVGLFRDPGVIQPEDLGCAICLGFRFGRKKLPLSFNLALMKIIALFLAAYIFAGSLFPQTDFSQMAKMSNVVKHFRLHQTETAAVGGRLSYADFFRIHFLQPDHHLKQADHSHEELPLHSISTSHPFIPFYYPTLVKPAIKKWAPISCFFYFDWLVRDFSSSHFNPPFRA